MRLSTLLTDARSSRAGTPPDPTDGFFNAARRIVDRHQLLVDSLLAVALLGAATAWLFDSPYLGARAAVAQVVLIAPLAWRRRQPVPVFAAVAVLAFIGWFIEPALIANAAVLVALYSVAVRSPRPMIAAAAATAEAGAFLAGFRWEPAGTWPRSLLFLTATVVAALCAGFTVRSASQYLSWLTERASILEAERDRQAAVAAAEERTRIAREMHDIVAHSLSVLVTLADAAALVTQTDPDRAEQAMQHASEVGRQALADMRTLLGVLRTGSDDLELLPQPGLDQLAELVEGVRATGLEVRVVSEGEAFALGRAAQLTLYRIVQESLTNTMKHAGATRATVTMRYAWPTVVLEVVDDGPPAVVAVAPNLHRSGPRRGVGVLAGHGIAGMRERATLHRGSVDAGPSSEGGWRVRATLRLGAPVSAS